MKLIVDVKRCVGHAQCQAVAPDLITLNDHGFNVTRMVLVKPGLDKQARACARACPEGIITLVEDD